jgi:D-glycero-beta-D-manno-heptose 1-phosphate adenylyltransferase
MRPSFENKFCAPGDLSRLAAMQPRKLVFTNGVFDVLHRGHVTYLAEARALGASLIVALNSDASVKRLGKGDDRPINALEDRMAVIAALECVNLVTWFEEDTPLQRILQSRPDVLVKGGDWAIDKIVGGAEVNAWGGEVHAIPFQFERSTTTMLAKIRAAAR